LEPCWTWLQIGTLWINLWTLDMWGAYILSPKIISQLTLLFFRVSTACLLALLSQFYRYWSRNCLYWFVLNMILVTNSNCTYFYRPGLVFLILLGLDITSHWFQMYRSVFSTTFFQFLQVPSSFSSSQHLIPLLI
jgi:hypothetical protein